MPRKIRQSLDELLQSLRNLPSKFRQYEAWEYIQQRLKGYQKENALVIDLKTEAMKDRHWKAFLLQLRINVTPAAATHGRKVRMKAGEGAYTAPYGGSRSCTSM